MAQDFDTLGVDSFTNVLNSENHSGRLYSFYRGSVRNIIDVELINSLLNNISEFSHMPVELLEHKNAKRLYERITSFRGRERKEVVDYFTLKNFKDEINYPFGRRSRSYSSLMGIKPRFTLGMGEFALLEYYLEQTSGSSESARRLSN